ncbi:hypothetical protein [Nocardia sp. BMG51109]|nr:hypothetical protein [Nocardia sp. BMG51109]
MAVRLRRTPTGHELSELITKDELTMAVTTSNPAGRGRNLFVFTETAGQ